MTTRKPVPALLLLALLLGVPTLAQEPADAEAEAAPEEAPAPCSSPEHRQFDFWIGDWEVHSPDGELQGTNRIEKILGGCALQENWSGASGTQGKSFNTYSAAHGEWRQFWVADAGYILELAGGLDDDGRMVLSGEAPNQREEGKIVHHEISWQPLPDGTVRQHWRVSRDGGETWQDLFVGIYSEK